MQELANRKPKIQAFVGDQEIIAKFIVVNMNVVGDVNQAGIELKVKNIGSATLTHPLIMAVSSNNKLSLQLKGANYPAAPNHYRSQLGGNNIFDFLAI